LTEKGTHQEIDMSEPLRTQSHRNSPTLRISAAGAEFAYREFGPQAGVPPVVLTHLGANLDSWDPRIVDGLAEDGHVIAVGYRGVGNSTGQIADAIEDMAEDMVAVIRGLGYDRVDVFGLSMGGMVAQSIAERAPQMIGSSSPGPALPEGPGSRR
jgi:pimeloyl-ACP methyl ester carboxylesterase